MGIFGLYGYNNFGDDLYAFLFATLLRRRGYAVTVFRVANAYSRIPGVEVARELPDFLDAVDLVVFAGGGMLLPGKSASYSVEWLARLGTLAKELARRKMPFAAVSVGGDGSLFQRDPDSPRIALARQASWITLRNDRDLEWVRSLGIQTSVFPDGILRIRSEAPPRAPRAARDTQHIGVHLYLPRKKSWLVRTALILAILARPTRRWTFIETNIGGRPAKTMRLNRFLPLPGVSYYTCTDPDADLEMLQSLDLLISSRLHLGLVALAYGTPVLSFDTGEKTKAQLQRLGMAALSWPRSAWLKLLRLLLKKDPGKEIRAHVDADRIAREVEESEAHFDRLFEWLATWKPADAS